MFACQYLLNQIFVRKSYKMGMFLYVFSAYLCFKTNANLTRPQGYKTFSMLNSAEHKIYPAHKC